MRPFRSLVASLGMTILLVACGATTPSPSVEPAGRPPLACVGIDRGRCEQVLAFLTERIGGTVPTYVQVSESVCDGPCPGVERGIWRAHVMAEFADGRAPLTATAEVDGAQVEWEQFETFMVGVTPKSGPANGAEVRLELGHCGLASGVDVDGSFWDPVGAVDWDHADAMNAATAIVTSTGPDTAMLRTERGLVVELVRHRGPKHLPGCD